MGNKRNKEATVGMGARSGEAHVCGDETGSVRIRHGATALPPFVFRPVRLPAHPETTLRRAKEGIY